MLSPPLDRWRATQIRHFLISLHFVPSSKLLCVCFWEALPRSCSSPSSPVINVCDADWTPGRPPYLRKWESDLSRTFPKEHILYFAHCSSIASRFQEVGFKVLIRWYRVPTLLHKIYSLVPSTCWRCQQPDGSLLHIFWTCSLVCPFWDAIRQLVFRLTDISLADDRVQCLLQLTPISRRQYKKYPLSHLFNAVKYVYRKNGNAQNHLQSVSG